MFHKPITVDQKPTPKWVVCDRKIDVTDVWIDEVDPENEDGETVTAFLLGNNFDDQLEVAGISIEDDMGGTVYRDREWFVRVVGADALYRIEEYEMQSPEIGSDDDYDIRKEERV